MKKRYYLLILLLLVAILAIYLSQRVTPLSDELKAEVGKAYRAEHKVALTWDDDSFGWSGMARYYGTYGDAVVYAFDANTCDVTNLEVAGEDFWWPQGFSIWVYHDGEIMRLEEAYEQEILTKRNVKKIARIHARYVRRKDFGH